LYLPHFFSSSHQNHNHQNGGTSAAGGFRSRTNSHSKEKANASGGAGSSARRNSLLQAVKNAQIAPDAPIILFMGFSSIAQNCGILLFLIKGGPGGGKTRYAAQLQEQMRDAGLVHICMPVSAFCRLTGFSPLKGFISKTNKSKWHS
jgi:hypothetical protein